MLMADLHRDALEAHLLERAQPFDELGLGRGPGHVLDQISVHDVALVYCDGTDVIAISVGNAGGDDIGPYDIGVYFPGQPGAGVTLLQLVTPRAFTLPVGLIGSQGYAGTAPIAEADLEIRKNGAPATRSGSA